MRIVSTSYINTPGYNDPETWLERISFYTGILEELAKQHEVESIEQINYTGKLERNAVVYHFLNFKKRKLYFPRRLHGIIKAIHPDVVFVNGFIFPFQTIQLKLKLGRRVKIIVINRAETPFSGYKKFVQRLADKCIHRYFFSSKEMGIEWVKKGIIADESKITEVMGASSFFYPIEKEKAKDHTKAMGHPVYLWVGRLDVNKDPMTVIKAFENFIRYQSLARLYMIYHTEELKYEISSYCENKKDLQTAIRMVGKVAHEAMQYWYNSADFIISGSHYEGGSIAVCEAMSCGCIPVVTNIQSFRKMTGPGKCGLLYEPGNEKELLAALLQTREFDMEKEKKRSLQQFKDELSFEAIARKISQVI